jgi:hypothetical protein
MIPPSTCQRRLTPAHADDRGAPASYTTPRDTIRIDGLASLSEPQQRQLRHRWVGLCLLRCDMYVTSSYGRGGRARTRPQRCSPSARPLPNAAEGDRPDRHRLNGMARPPEIRGFGRQGRVVNAAVISWLQSAARRRAGGSHAAGHSAGDLSRISAYISSRLRAVSAPQHPVRGQSTSMDAVLPPAALTLLGAVARPLWQVAAGCRGVS